ncbi:hypothetical protein P8452_60514 [Trifolium repens]|nr:hypothetical protein P8452_60514 [Trifolium repens]
MYKLNFLLASYFVLICFLGIESYGTHSIIIDDYIHTLIHIFIHKYNNNVTERTGSIPFPGLISHFQFLFKLWLGGI